MSLSNFSIKIKFKSIYDEKNALLLIFRLKSVNDTKLPCNSLIQKLRPPSHITPNRIIFILPDKNILFKINLFISQKILNTAYIETLLKTFTLIFFYISLYHKLTYFSQSVIVKSFDKHTQKCISFYNCVAQKCNCMIQQRNYTMYIYMSFGYN